MLLRSASAARSRRSPRPTTRGLRAAFPATQGLPLRGASTPSAWASAPRGRPGGPRREAKAKLTEEAEQAQQRAEEEKKAEEEDKVPKYVLTKYERIEREAVRKSHRASDAIDATLSP